MNNLLSVLFSTIKAKITPIVTKIKYWTSWSFIRSKIIGRIRDFLSKIFGIRPRDKNDYYQMFGFLVSKRLAHAVVIVIGILCLYYLWVVNPVFGIVKGIETGKKVYTYKSVPLRFAEGEVKIRAKSGYIAYEGNVSKGYATGYGELFDENGAVVYRGIFEKNQYNGTGKLYYPIGQVKYEGEFVNNLFQGTGKLYRENGTKEYEGDFSAGVKEGSGVLYDGTERAVFTGSFHSDELVYSQLLGKTAAEIREIYTGTESLYQYDDQWISMLEDIDAFYVGENDESSLDDEIRADSIYVEKDYFIYGDKKISTIDDLTAALGTPVSEGNSYVAAPEAVGIEWEKKKGAQIDLDTGLEVSTPYEGYNTVDDFNTDTLVYLYVYQKDDITYTFISAGRNEGFFMYQMEK